MCRYSVSPDVECQPIDDVLIVLHLTQNAYYKLNHCARFFFEHIAAGESKGDIVKKARAVYADADEAALSADFDDVVGQFVDLGFLVRK